MRKLFYAAAGLFVAATANADENGASHEGQRRPGVYPLDRSLRFEMVGGT